MPLNLPSVTKQKLALANRLLDSLGFVLLFGQMSNAELVKTIFWIKDQLTETE